MSPRRSATRPSSRGTRQHKRLRRFRTDGIDLTIRPARAADIPRLVAYLQEASSGVVGKLYEGAIPGRPVEVIMEHHFTRYGTAQAFPNCRIAEVGGEIAGGLHTCPADALINGPPDLLISERHRAANAPFAKLRTPGACHVLWVCVEPTFRGRGVGSAMMAEAETRARAEGHTLMSLNVAEENAGAVRLYESLGYRETRRAHVDVPGALEGHVIHMTRAL